MKYRKTILMVVLLNLGVAIVSGEPQIDVNSREFTVYNTLSEPVQIVDVVSREFTVINDLTNRVTIMDAISREITIFNDLTNPITITGVVARELTVFNDLTNPVIIADVVSREFTAQNTFACIGNMTDDGLVTMEDVPGFVQVLLGNDTDSFLQSAADLNCDGAADGKDVEEFVNAILEG